VSHSTARGWWKRAREVLAGAQIDRSLAADRRVDLREQRGRAVYDRDAAHVERGGETAQIVRRAAAERDDGRAAVEARRGQLVERALEHQPGLRGFAARKHHGGRARERTEPRSVQLERALVRDDGAGTVRRALRAELLQHTRADVDPVGRIHGDVDGWQRSLLARGGALLVRRALARAAGLDERAETGARRRCLVPRARDATARRARKG
jgi:hypothetical protein